MASHHSPFVSFVHMLMAGNTTTKDSIRIKSGTPCIPISRHGTTASCLAQTDVVGAGIAQHGRENVLADGPCRESSDRSERGWESVCVRFLPLNRKRESPVELINNLYRCCRRALFKKRGYRRPLFLRSSSSCFFYLILVSFT